MNSNNGRVYYPNEKLRLIPFINITRSGNKASCAHSGGLGVHVHRSRHARLERLAACLAIHCLDPLGTSACKPTDSGIPAPAPLPPPPLQGESFKVAVDLSTPAAPLMEALRLAAEGVIRGAPTEFNGKLAVNLREGGTPLKMVISVRRRFGGRLGRVWRQRSGPGC